MADRLTTIGALMVGLLVGKMSNIVGNNIFPADGPASKAGSTRCTPCAKSVQEDHPRHAKFSSAVVEANPVYVANSYVPSNTDPNSPSPAHLAGADEHGPFYKISFSSWTPGGAWPSACPGIPNAEDRGRCGGGKGVYYHRFYPYFLAPLRNTAISLLEIGLDVGGSLKLWEEYFPKAKIFGADIVAKPHLKDKRVQIFQARQENKTELNNLIKKTKFATGAQG